MLASNSAIHPKPRLRLSRHLSCCSASCLEPPTSREVHVWCLFPDEVHDTDLLCSYKSILPSEERNILYQAKPDKVQEYLLTRILARTLLARYTGGVMDPSALRFERGKHGKPRIVWPTESNGGKMWNPPKINFNISHTRSMIVCAITGASQIGIDVEDKNRATHTNLMRFARRKFSATEAAQLEQLTDSEAHKRHFLQLWTLKESYGKAVGNGIVGTTLRDAAFAFGEFSAASDFLKYLTGVRFHEQVFTIKASIVNDENFWQFVLLQLTNSHNVSICLHRQDVSVQDPLHLQIMKIIPLVKEEFLFEAVTLGLTV
ncbi:hypothetical protein GOP47_0000127 [Adiantum capillus-veneris]|uniref:holo-[acyl-carrier-protein] synthase n=1 Tax=Adiantum capillus-veneris TaxID=13818 RepID=A0A9D4VED7_ADICA|nr:hypothetical protein GOP47_0000127 [Adiantum capillus-veneris]